MKKIFIFLIFLIFLILSSVITNAQGNIIAKKVMPSVVLIVMEDTNGQMIGQGSGFYVSKNIIATNFHVIEGGSRGFVKFVNSERKINIEGVVGIDKSHDIVLLSVFSDAPYLTLGDFNSVETGENVYVVGNPRGLEGTFSQGIVSSIRNIEGDKLLQITAPISPGSSGGPVLNAKGDVIGVSVATYKDGQNLNFAVPVSYLKSLMKNIKNPVSISSVSSPTFSSFTKKIGGKITGGVEGGQFLWGRSHSYSSSDKSVKQGELKEYSFSIRNNLRSSIKNLIIHVLIYDNNNDLIESEIVSFENEIKAGLASRIESIVYESTYKLTKNGKFEIRIVDFEIVE